MLGNLIRLLIVIPTAEVKDIAQTLTSQWHRKTGLIIALIFVATLEIALVTGTSSNMTTAGILISLSCLVIWALWFYYQQPPKARKDRLGFAVALRCDDEVEGKIIREDFVRTLRGLIKSRRSGITFDFIEIPAHLSEKVEDPDHAELLRVKTRAWFLIYGRVRLRCVGKNRSITWNWKR
jgi:hypothetical protein